MTNYTSQTIDNIYNTNILNNIKELELNQIKKKKYNSDFLNQFDELNKIILELEQKIKSLIDSHKKEQRAARKPEIKGVHTEEGTYQKLPKGLENVSSKYGSVISNQPYKDKWSSISDQLKGAQKVASKRKQEEIKKMPAPKLAASEEKIVKNQFVVKEVELNSKCTDCNKPQFTLTKNEHKFTPCICYASENQGKEPFVKLIKSEGGTKLYFNSKADPESVKSFLLTLKLGLLAKKISK